MDGRKTEYPEDWEAIATGIKNEAGWRCERCGHKHDVESRHVLTVHHLVPDKALCEPWNLAVLCQRCHLKVQARVNMFFELVQGLLFDRTGWLVPHLKGFMEWMAREIDEGG